MKWRSTKTVTNWNYKSGVYSRWGQLTTYKKENGSYRVEGVRGDYQFLENATLVAGRFINQSDLNTFEKVAVIGNQVYLDLFKR